MENTKFDVIVKCMASNLYIDKKISMKVICYQLVSGGYLGEESVGGQRVWRVFQGSNVLYRNLSCILRITLIVC